MTAEQVGEQCQKLLDFAEVLGFSVRSFSMKESQAHDGSVIRLVLEQVDDDGDGDR